MSDLSRPDHLPNLRPGRQPPHPSWLPRQRRGSTPQMIGRYPDYDVLTTAHTWDEATRKVVLARLQPPGPLRFFSADEEPALRALCDTALAQDDEPRVPVAETVDRRLAEGKLDGYRYADMPTDGETWRRVLRGLDETAQRLYGAASFADAAPADREGIVELFAHGNLSGGSWDKLNVARAWAVCMRMMLSSFYAHPWAWNEIGFGGPAYPRGFMRTGTTAYREPFERSGATSEDAARVAGEELVAEKGDGRG